MDDLKLKADSHPQSLVFMLQPFPLLTFSINPDIN